MKYLGDDQEHFNSKFPNFDIEVFLSDNERDWKIFDSATHQEVAINCPSCTDRGEPSPDEKKKLWINPGKGTFYCYRCQWAGSLVRLIMKLTNSPMHTALKVLRGSLLDPMDHLDLRLFNEKFESDIADDEELKEVELPYGYEPIDGPHPYLVTRGIPWQYARDNDWGISAAGYTKNRIIVPMFMDSRLVFWQARATWESGDKDFKKVLNPTGVSARKILYNYDRAKNYKKVILVEGFIDAVKVGPDAMATNAKVLHTQQIEYLKDSNCKEVVLMWDLDAWTDASSRRRDKRSSIHKASDLLRSYGFQVKAVRLPEGRDPGSYNYCSKALRKLIDSAQEPRFDTLKI